MLIVEGKIKGILVDEFISNNIGEVIVSAVIYLLIRSIKGIDKTIEILNGNVQNLDKTCDQLALDVQSRPSWPRAKSMSKEVTKAAINQHIIDDHKTT